MAGGGLLLTVLRPFAVFRWGHAVSLTKADLKVQTSSKNRREHGKHSGKTAAASGISTGLSTHNHRRTELCFPDVLADDSTSRRTRIRPSGTAPDGGDDRREE